MSEQTDILIIGAGPTGLGAAWRLDALGHNDWLLLEAESQAGGLAGSHVDEHGFTWDYGGHVQFSHYDYFDKLMDELLDQEGWIYHERESWILLRDNFVPFPFQHNLHRLPQIDTDKCLQGLQDVSVHADCDRPADFGEWIDASFGRGISDLFMRPYNNKV